MTVYERDEETNTSRIPMRIAPCLNLNCRCLNFHPAALPPIKSCARCGAPTVFSDRRPFGFGRAVPEEG